MKIGDIVNVKKYGGGYWRGKIVSISEGYDESIKYTEPIATVNEINGGRCHSVQMESDLCDRNGEYYER